jgi:hypothetical protein
MFPRVIVGIILKKMSKGIGWIAKLIPPARWSVYIYTAVLRRSSAKLLRDSYRNRRGRQEIQPLRLLQGTGTES